MSLIYSIEMIENKIFPLMFSKLDVNAFNVSCSNDMIWHRRYGHLNLVGLKLLHKEKMTTDFSGVIGERDL